VKDTIGYLKRAIWISSILFFTFFLLHTDFSKPISAQETLTTNAVFSHNIKENNKVETTITFTISSPTRTVLTYYTITIPQENLKPETYSVSRSQRLESTVYNRSGSTDILIDFENSVISENGSTKVSIFYVHDYTDQKAIQLISKIADTPTSEVSISYPKDWGELTWISDQIDNIKMSDTQYIVRVTKPDATNIRLIFGQNIAYSFNISRSLNNEFDVSNQYEIIIPHDNQFQKIIIEEMSIQPTQAFIDNSNNYTLIFTLEPQSQVDVKISGYILMGEHEYYRDDIQSTYSSRDIYWSLEQRQIDRIERYLKDNGIDTEKSSELMVEYIYKYVIENLTPSSSATTLSGGIRRGATEVLKTSEESTPEDYADVLKAFLSYFEIPSIYTVGYVSEISSYQDSGMFHYWVQAFDGNKWQVLDPYLEDYSTVPLLGREQLDHISILSRTEDSISPILTYYSDNDIRFDYLGENSITYEPASNISMTLEPYSILNKYLYGKINIENTGNTIFTNITLRDSQPDLHKYVDSITNSANTILLPNMHRDISFHIPFNDIEDDMIFTTIELKNGEKVASSEILSTEYTLSQRTGYEVVIKIISIVIFIITFSLIYLFIDKIVYKK
jgi:hypothetical protein